MSCDVLERLHRVNFVCNASLHIMNYEMTLVICSDKVISSRGERMIYVNYYLWLTQCAS